MKKRFSEEEIIGFLREAEAGMQVKELGELRLATAERELLGVVREDDLPGAEAPTGWLTYLRGGSAASFSSTPSSGAPSSTSKVVKEMVPEPPEPSLA